MSAEVPDSLFYFKNKTLTTQQTKESLFESKINPTILAVSGTAALAAGIGMHYYLQNASWRKPTSNFHFQKDHGFALGQDKIGHFYSTNLIGHAFSAALEAGEIDAEKSQLWGGIGAFAFQMFVEIEDGFDQNSGFNYSEALFDLAGAGFFASQYYFPFMKNIQPRISYLKSDKYKKGFHQGNIINDYEGQKFWLGFRLKQMLPKKIAKFWPSFLMISAGTGVTNIDGLGGVKREFYLALDLDAEEIPLYGKFWQFIKNTLNYFHFPLPGIRISPNTAFFMFVF